MVNGIGHALTHLTHCRQMSALAWKDVCTWKRLRYFVYLPVTSV